MLEVTDTYQVRRDEASRSKFHNIRAVLFDLYGTLGNHGPDVNADEIISRFLIDRGFDTYPQQTRASINYVFFVDYPARRCRSFEEYLRQILFRLDVSLKKREFMGLKEFGRQCMIDSFQLYPDVIPTVRPLMERGYKMGIVTTTPLFIFKKAIEPINTCFDAITTGYEAQCDKSNPRIYTYTLGRLGLKPHEVVMVGDETKLDVEVPQSLGINSILLSRGQKEENQQDISTLTELLKLLP